ncbi:1935_t:CDS:2, partial [Diversispora eburnea]
VGEEFMEHYPSLKIDCSTVSKILKRADEYQFQDDVAETTFHHCPVKKKPVNLHKHLLPEGSLTFSNGWVTKFKKHNEIRKITMHSEAASAPLENLPKEWKKLQELLSHYNSEDMYNADETGNSSEVQDNDTDEPSSESENDSIGEIEEF